MALFADVCPFRTTQWREIRANVLFGPSPPLLVVLNTLDPIPVQSARLDLG
jgi:hypothetical protein